MAKLRCPKCKGHNIVLLANDLNTKTVSRTSVNLNPLHPLTFANTKTVQKKKKLSKGKIALGLVTGGTSLLFTGIKKSHNEYFCSDCGKRWVGP